MSIDQSGRNDIKHVDMMILCVRAFIGDLAVQVGQGDLGARTIVNLLGEVWEIVTNPQALQSTRMWGFDFSNVWPHTELESTGNDKVSRWLQHRFPKNPT